MIKESPGPLANIKKCNPKHVSGLKLYYNFIFQKTFLKNMIKI